MAWTGWLDLLNQPFYSKDSCTLIDQDNLFPPVLNDCMEPVSARLFRKPYFDDPTLGKKASDWEQYWTGTSLATGHRTRDFEWRWRLQDYPHLPSYAYLPQTDKARVRLWIRPMDKQQHGGGPFLVARYREFDRFRFPPVTDQGAPSP